MMFFVKYFTVLTACANALAIGSAKTDGGDCGETTATKNEDKLECGATATAKSEDKSSEDASKSVKPQRLNCMISWKNQIAQGTHGSIYKPDTVELGDGEGAAAPQQPIVIKVMGGKSDPIRAGRIQDKLAQLEIRAHERLSEGGGHPNVVQLFGFTTEKQFFGLTPEQIDAGIHDVCYAMLLEEVAGPDLHELFFAGDYTQTISNMDNLLERLFPQIVRAFKYIHDKNIAHLDIKPANIMVTNEGDVKMIDFGCAKMGEDADFQVHRSEKWSCGSDYYRSPEVGMWYSHPRTGAATVAVHSDYDSESFDPRKVDIYAIGMIFCDVLTAIDRFSVSRLRDILRLRAYLRTHLNHYPAVLTYRYLNPEYAKEHQRMVHQQWTHHMEEYRKNWIRFFTTAPELSDNEKNLIANMLNVDAEKRFNIDQILDHPWMKDAAAKAAELAASKTLSPTSELEDYYQTIAEAEKQRRSSSDSSHSAAPADHDDATSDGPAPSLPIAKSHIAAPPALAKPDCAESELPSPNPANCFRPSSCSKKLQQSRSPDNYI